jgi:hypothetical protein
VSGRGLSKQRARGRREIRKGDSTRKNPVRGMGSPHRPRHGRGCLVSNQSPWAEGKGPSKGADHVHLDIAMDGRQMAGSERRKPVALH